MGAQGDRPAHCGRDFCEAVEAGFEIPHKEQSSRYDLQVSESREIGFDGRIVSERVSLSAAVIGFAVAGACVGEWKSGEAGSQYPNKS